MRKDQADKSPFILELTQAPACLPSYKEPPFLIHPEEKMGTLLYTEGSALDARQTVGTILRTGWAPTFLAGIGPVPQQFPV